MMLIIQTYTKAKAFISEDTSKKEKNSYLWLMRSVTFVFLKENFVYLCAFFLGILIFLRREVEKHKANQSVLAHLIMRPNFINTSSPISKPYDLHSGSNLNFSLVLLQQLDWIMVYDRIIFKDFFPKILFFVLYFFSLPFLMFYY